MKKDLFLTGEPGMDNLLKVRSELTVLIKELVENVQEFCKDIHLSTASFYRIYHMQYVTESTWNKLFIGFCKVATKEEFDEYCDAYGYAFYTAFSDR